MRESSDTIFVKFFNNFIKTILIQQFCRCSGKDISVLDLCSGRGGDLGKWQKQNIAHYVAVDLADELVKEAQKRYLETYVNVPSYKNRGRQIFKAIFVVNDAGDKNNLLDTLLSRDQRLKDIN